MLVVVLESLAVDLPLALGQVRGQEVLRVAVANVQEFPANIILIGVLIGYNNIFVISIARWGLGTRSLQGCVNLRQTFVKLFLLALPGCFSAIFEKIGKDLSPLDAATEMEWYMVCDCMKSKLDYVKVIFTCGEACRSMDDNWILLLPTFCEYLQIWPY